MELTRFNELWKVVNEIGIKSISSTELVKFYNEGLETDLSDIFTIDTNELVTILKDGSIRKTIVYISEISPFNEKITYPKFHIFDCTTLQRMRKNKRMYRYKKTLKKDGMFYMIITDNFNKIEKKYEKLDICKNCLNEYNKVNKIGISVKNFDLKKYIKNFNVSELNRFEFKPDNESIPKIYVKEWSKISKKMKEMRKHICEKCNIDLRNNPEYLHTHHINGDIRNNCLSNLKVLCLECHSNEFNHSHMKNNEKYNEFIKIKKGLI